MKEGLVYIGRSLMVLFKPPAHRTIQEVAISYLFVQALCFGLFSNLSGGGW